MQTGLSEGNAKFHRCDRMYSSGVDQSSGASSSLFCGVSSSLHDHSDREHCSDCFDQHQPQLQSPMSFFLSHLSFVDVWFSSKVTPKMRKTYHQRQKPLPMCGVWCSVTSSEPLATWEYISWLWWPLIATWPSATLCFTAAKCPGPSGLASSLCHASTDSVSLICTPGTYGLYFCGTVETNHFYCAEPPLILRRGPR